MDARMILFGGIVFILLGINNIQLVICKNLLADSFDVAKNQSDEYQLIFAHIIYRHGNRNIFRSYPNDPYGIEGFWPGGYSQLTNVGKQEQFELGSYLRRRYLKLIGTRYSADKVYIRSSDTDRTLMSAQCNAAGMFPPSGDEVWNDSQPWQPVPIHTVPYSEDYLLNSFMRCPRYDQLYKEYTESTSFKYQMKRYSDLLEYLRFHSGRMLPNPIEVMFLIVVLVEEKEKGFVLPSWVDNISRYTNDTLEQIIAIHLESRSHTNEMKKIRAGFLIKEMYDRFKNKSLSLLKPDRSVYIYSAHDTIIVNILNALNLYEPHIPPYASGIFFELYRQNDNYFVQLFYRKTPTEDVPPLSIPFCGTMCPLDQFFELYKHILPSDSEDLESLCRLPT